MSLDSLGWRDNSPLWDLVAETDEIPGLEDVSFPNQLERDVTGDGGYSSLSMSPIVNPAVRRVAAGDLTPISKGQSGQ